MKNLSAILFVFAALLCFNTNAQSWVFNFGSIAKDEATTITEDNTGDIITAGLVSDTANFFWRGNSYNMFPWRGNCFIAKQSAGGQLIWLRHIGGSGSIQVKDIVTDAQDNFYITGLFSDTADFNPTSNNFDLISTDPQGDVFVAKYDNWGNFIWAKGIGGIGIDNAASILISRDSNIFITGSFEGSVDFDPGTGIRQVNGNGAQDAFVLKLGLAGDFKSVYTFGGLGVDYCTDLKEDSRGNLLVSGSFERQVDFNPTNSPDTLTAVGLSDAFILQLDRNLSFNWVERIGGGGVDEILSTAVNTNDKVYLVGAFEGSCDFDPGIGVSRLLASNIDGFILQLDSTGSFGWVNKLGGLGDDRVVDVAIGNRNEVYVTGVFSDTVDFDPDTSAVYNLVAQGNFDHYIYQLDTSGSFGWLQQFTGSSQSTAHRVFLDSQNNLYTAGSFEGTVDFDPTLLVNSKIAAGQSDIFIQKHSSSPLVSLLDPIVEEDGSIKLYPNPSQERFRVDFQKTHKTVEMKIYDVQGRIRWKSNYSNVEYIEVDVEEESGVYFVELILNERERKTLKIVKN